ncbi:hypothetical protein NCAS_0H01390 [Naumovozyma castellii]|uniref:Uncharacterized protein n=1 Tax=Naumovozyma castellii TaxID=27288 RepID=G0VIX2_NAUCA|nr:hypothetical protein NCAS_0H01390 [Naumovozyma castellii CBS 4309]CCC71449.1 hypothetical protein NCAS_0H01390 [Naumovozyma castellii CBS 4309]
MTDTSIGKVNAADPECNPKYIRPNEYIDDYTAPKKEPPARTTTPTTTTTMKTSKDSKTNDFNTNDPSFVTSTSSNTRPSESLMASLDSFGRSVLNASPRSSISSMSASAAMDRLKNPERDKLPLNASATSVSSKSENKEEENIDSKYKYDWNELPKATSSVLIRKGNLNKVEVKKDGIKKMVEYDPMYNKRLAEMDLFFTFNLNSTPKDALINSKKRVLSYTSFLTDYLKVRKSAFESYSLDVDVITSIETVLKSYISFNPLYDYGEIERILELWYLQADKFLLQSNSGIFSNEIIQYLLKRKSLLRQSNQSNNNSLEAIESSKVTFNEAYDDKTEGKVGNDSLIGYQYHDIDILLIRPKLCHQRGWQLAYDEPSLNIADFELDTSPWLEHGSASSPTITEGKTMASNMDKYIPKNMGMVKGIPTLKIVKDMSELKELDSETAPNYMVDCMDRKIFASKSNRPSSVDEAALAGEQQQQQQQQQDITASKRNKKGRNKNTRKSGMLNFFKRKHSQLTLPASSVTPTSAGSIISEKTMSTGDQNENNQNIWLEDYFCKALSNYQRVILPTQYILPGDGKLLQVQTTESDDSSLSLSSRSKESSNFKSHEKNALLYGKEFLQIRLPFKTDSIPTISCPGIWTNLTYNKWRALLREMYRCIIPGGYITAIVADIKVSNSYREQNDTDDDTLFETTLERDKSFDAMTLEAINKGLHIHPTKHMTKSFKEVGFTGIKSTVLSLKTGDFKDDMGCLDEFVFLQNWDYTLRRQLPDGANPPKGLDPTTLFDRYVKEHWGKIDDNAGCFRTLYIVAQKPKRQAYK